MNNKKLSDILCIKLLCSPIQKNKTARDIAKNKSIKRFLHDEVCDINFIGCCLASFF